MKSFQNITGGKIRLHRMASALSQDQLAAKLQLAGWDISRGGLAKIEAGIRLVNDAEILLIAQVLGVEISEFFPKSPASEISQVVRQGRENFAI